MRTNNAGLMFPFFICDLDGIVILRLCHRKDAPYEIVIQLTIWFLSKMFAISIRATMDERLKVNL